MSIGKSRLSVVPDVDQKLPCLGHLKKIVSCRNLRVVPPQHIIFSQGESPHTVWFICDGLVKMTRTESNGKPIIVGLRRTGWILGAGAILPERPYASTAETVTRSKLCCVPTEKLKQAMETNPLFSKWITTIYSGEVYSSMITICERSSLSGRQRLEKFICEIIRIENKNK
jgi:CRP-like cAMP-binding protein